MSSTREVTAGKVFKLEHHENTAIKKSDPVKAKPEDKRKGQWIKINNA